MEDISKNSLEMMDSKLFVGDKVGMKQMKKKMASKPDTNIVFMSGLSQQETEEVETEGASSSRRRDSREEEREERELMSSDEDVDTALALSLSSAGGPGGPSQQQILEMIESDTKIGDQSSEDEDEIVVLLPPTSVFTSNRKGGRELQPLIKEEPQEETEAESVGIISEDDSESDDDFEEVVPEVTGDQSEEDIFADVFSTVADIDKINSIVGLNESQEETIASSPSCSTKQPEKKSDPKKQSRIVNEDAETILERITKLDKPGDILSDIVSRANKKQEKSAFTKAVSDNLKNGPGIMMKIASKWADAEVKKSENIEEADSDPDDDLSPAGPLAVFDEEQDLLVEEMETAERAKKLLRFTGASSADLRVETVSKNKNTEDRREDPAPAPSVSEENLETKETKETREAREARETKELEELQSRLAAEEDSLVAELSKAERLSSSITDQMYSECQQLLQMFGLPWLVAPGEAEAQCAQLDQAGLTEGTITEDSDIWLFGGTRVYKNFFNQEKYVEYFTATEVVAHFGLTRDKLSTLIGDFPVC